MEKHENAPSKGSTKAEKPPKTPENAPKTGAVPICKIINRRFKKGRNGIANRAVFWYNIV